MHYEPMTIDYMTGVIDKTRGDADTVRDTVIIHDIVEDRHSIIAYDYQIEDILSPYVDANRHEEEPDFSEELTHAWHWRYHEKAVDVANSYGFGIEYFKDFLERHSGKHDIYGREINGEPTWTYPEGLNHKFTRTRPHVT